MALFGKTPATKKAAPAKAVKAKEEKKPKATTEVVATVVKEEGGKIGGLDLAHVLVRPHVTEKATDLSERGNVYAFEVNTAANKLMVVRAIEKYYKVTPIKVAVVNLKSKYTKSRTNNRVVLKKQGLKKALVYLKKGDKIEFV